MPGCIKPTLTRDWADARYRREPLIGRVTGRRPVVRIDGERRSTRPDTLAAEEPLEIRVSGTPLSVTMRTPGNDFDLVAGFLVSEGVTAATSELLAMRYCAGATADGENTYNVIDATLAAGVAPPAASLARTSTRPRRAECAARQRSMPYAPSATGRSPTIRYGSARPC